LRISRAQIGRQLRRIGNQNLLINEEQPRHITVEEFGSKETQESIKLVPFLSGGDPARTLV
jgi:hypothetical protein